MCTFLFLFLFTYRLFLLFIMYLYQQIHTHTHTHTHTYIYIYICLPRALQYTQIFCADRTYKFRMLSFMLLEVTTGCKTLNYIRTVLRTASVVIGTKLAVTWKCWNRKTEGIFSKGFTNQFPFPVPEEKMRAGLRNVVF